jgi:hypothetical protein
MNTHKDLVKARFQLNMGRINALAKLGFSNIDSLKPCRADILRTVVVFLHATFEDLLRTMARQRIAVANSQVLDSIPLVGTSRSGRAEKFHLGALNAHRGKTVDQLIQESVENYLDRESFASCHDVEEVLTQMGLDTAPFKPYYADLDQMMKRRHRIVHEADLPSPNDSLPASWTIADDYNLSLWLLVVPIFYGLLRMSVDPADEVQRWFVEKWIKGVELIRVWREEFIAVRKEPPELMLLNLQKATARLSQATEFLGQGPSDEEMLSIWKTTKSPDDNTTDDNTTEEQVRAEIVAWRDNTK